MANVLLLRSPSTGDDDRYSGAFTAAGYHSVSAPVLETVPTNLNRLTEIVRVGPTAENYDGVIITSARSCEAWNTIVGDLIKEHPLGASISASEWSSIPFYVVGKATASAISSIREAYGQTPYTPGATLGESSGTGEHLANFILSLEGPSRPKKVLYLTGDKNRDTVPRILEAAGIVVIPVKVYETQFSSTFAQDLEDALQSASKEIDRWWIVHFAPSSARSATPILCCHFKFDFFEPSSEFESSTLIPAVANIASIGPVTTSFLQDELKMRVHATASRPTPDDLVTAITAYDQRS